jgi:hypothetical protein
LAVNIVNRFRRSGHSIRPPPVFLNERAGLLDYVAALARQNTMALTTILLRIWLAFLRQGIQKWDAW